MYSAPVYANVDIGGLNMMTHNDVEQIGPHQGLVLVEAVASPIHEIVLLKLNILLLENFYGPLAPVYETALGKNGGPMWAGGKPKPKLEWTSSSARIRKRCMSCLPCEREETIDDAQLQ